MRSWTLWLPYKEHNGVFVISTHSSASLHYVMTCRCNVLPRSTWLALWLGPGWNWYGTMFQQGHRAHTGSLGTRLWDEKFQCKHLLAWRQRDSVVCQSCIISGYCNCRLSLLTECNPFTNHSELLQYYHTGIIGSRLDDMLCTRHYISDCKPVTDFW